MADSNDYIARARVFIRERGAAVTLEVLVNFVLPFLIFDFGKPRLGDVHALMLSSAPPIAWSIIEFIRRRRVDALSMLVLAGIALSLLAYLGGGSVKFLQLREKLVTVAIGLVFLGSAAIGKPLIYQLARATIQRRSPSELESFEALKDNIFFRRTMLIMTLVWGFGLVGEAAVAASLVMVLTIKQYLIVGPVVGYGTMGALSFWTYWYSRRKRREGEARRARDAAALEASPQATP
jgi:intracellular septation protein A